MATSQQKRKNRKQILALLLAVIVVVAVSLGFQNWWNSRPETPPSELAITVETSDGQTLEIYPYMICEAGEDCDAPDKVTTINVPDDASVHLTIPSEIYDHDWTLLQIYDDPAVNDEFYYAANERTEVELDITITAPERSADATDTEADTNTDNAGDDNSETTPDASATTTTSTESAADNGANDNSESSSTARLVVAEISSLQIDYDNDGNEVPVAATWSIAFEEN